MDHLNSPNSLNSFSVVPPISEGRRDKKFLHRMNEWINDELSKVNVEDPEQQYHVYKEAFGKIIDYLGVYKPLLNRIKVEYEDCINTIRDGQHEAFFLAGKLSEMANAPMALQNYRKRKEELAKKLSLIEGDNERLLEELTELKSQRAAKDVEEQSWSTAVHTETGRASKAKTRGPVPGLTIEQATDCDLLQRELEKFEREFRDLSLCYQNRYSSKDLENELKECLATGVISKEQLSAEIEHLKQKQSKLTVAVQAAQAYLKIQPPHETIGLAVVTALTRDFNNIDSDTITDVNQRITPSPLIEEEDVSHENQTEVLLDYIEKFNELLESEMYSEAALHAANGIKGILRTPETMQRFKEISVGYQLPDNPLLMFCDALMSTVPSFEVRPNELMSEECVRCALKEKRLDLLTHWVSQDRLTVSEKVADLIFNFATKNNQSNVAVCLSLAQKIYIDVMSHVSAMVCMVKQQRVKQALEYAGSKHCSTDDLIQVLRRCPDLQLSDALYGFGNFNHPASKCRLPLGVILTALFNSLCPENGLIFLENVYSCELKKSGEAAFIKAVADDPITSFEQWNVFIEQCRQSQSRGKHMADIADCLLAAATANNAAVKI